MKYCLSQCPVCGNTDFVFAYQRAGAAAYIMEGLSWPHSDIEHQVCTKCGTIVRSCASDLDDLLRKHKTQDQKTD